MNEKAYQTNLQRLDELFPSREMLSIQDVCRITGHARRTCLRRYRFDRNKEVSKADFARQMTLEA